MAIFENVPYTNFHELNLDWVIQKQKEHDDAFSKVIEDANEIKDATEALKNDTQAYAENAAASAEESEMYRDNSLLIKSQIETMQDQIGDTVEAVNASFEQIQRNAQGVAVNSSRIDQLSTLTEGSTTGDAELMDIRIGADGVTYPSAGDAVRGQFDVLMDNLDMISSETKNLYDNSTGIPKSYINSSGGINESSDPNYENFVTSQFIDVSAFSDIVVLHMKPWGLAFYDSQKTFIERLTGSNVPMGRSYSLDRDGTQAAFIRVTYNGITTAAATAFIAGGTDTTLPYEPYGRKIDASAVDIDIPEDIITASNYNSNGIYGAEFIDFNYIPTKIRQAAWRGETMYADYQGETVNTTRYAPDNSWPAFKKAVESDFDMLWLAAVHYSREGTFYVYHDNTITIDGETKSFYEFTDEQIQSYIIANNSVNPWTEEERKIPLLEDVIRYCIRNGMRIGFRLGQLPSAYVDSTIGTTSITRKAIWDAFMQLIARYDLKESIFSGSANQCNVVSSFNPMYSVQLSESMPYTVEDVYTLITDTIALTGKRKSINTYVKSGHTQNIVLTEEVMNRCRAANIRVFAVLTEGYIVKEEIDAILELCPDYLVTHYKLDLSSM